jgi:hypothetical protein
VKPAWRDVSLSDRFKHRLVRLLCSRVSWVIEVGVFVGGVVPDKDEDYEKENDFSEDFDFFERLCSSWSGLDEKC